MAAPRSAGPAVFLGSPLTHNTPLVPHWSGAAHGPLLAVWDPRFFRAHRQPTTLINYSQHSAKGNCHSSPWCQNANGTHAARPYKTTEVVKPKSTVDKQWKHGQEQRCTDQTHSVAPVKKHHHGDPTPPANPSRDNKHRASQGDTTARLCNVTDTSATVELKRAACFLLRQAYMSLCAHATTLIRHLSSNSGQLLPRR